MNLQELILWFRNLKKDGISKEDVLDILDFDSDAYPTNIELLKEAREIVYG
jgi:hypothetical protein